MRLLTAALVMSLFPSAAGAVALQNAPVLKGAPPSSSTECPQITSYYAYRSGEPLEPRKLTELPPANAYSAVYRHIGSCEVPIIIGYRVGRR